VVRNPLDRFLSAYRDKMETRNQREKANFRNIVKDLNQHQPNFSNFVDTMLGMPVEKWDQHWAPIHRLCPPCAGFHAVARMETFSDDSQYIIQMAGLSHILEVPWRNEKRKSVRSTFQLQLSYYRQLTPPQLERLVEVYRVDFETYGYDPRPFLWMAKQPMN